MNGEWVAYHSNDIQLEFRMVYPYVRESLKGDAQGNFQHTFTIPDVWGVFTLKVNYERFGYSTIALSEVVAVRPYRHDEYPRFLEAAYPYYAGSFSMLVGIFFFSLFFLYQRDK